MAEEKYGLLINFVEFDALTFARLVMNFSKIAQEKFGCELRIRQSMTADDNGCPDCRIALECEDEDCIQYLIDVYKTARCLHEDKCLGEISVRFGQKVESPKRGLHITPADL